jgi:hypothetical protein
MVSKRLPPSLARFLKVLAIVAGASFGAFGFVSATSVEAPSVPLQFDQYIHRMNGAPADPINVIFLTTSSDIAAAEVHRVLGWDVVDGSPMTFIDNGANLPIASQMGVQFTRSSRWHMRIEQATRQGPGSYVLAAVHRDDDSACGHIGTAFDRGRRVVAAAFANAGYDVTTLRLGNSQPGIQCDGSYTSGDGTAVVIDLTKSARPG